MAPDVSVRNSPFFPKGIQGTERIKRLITDLRSLIPDLWIRVEDIVGEGEKVVVRWTGGGTQKGQWEEGIPATGKRVEWSGIGIFRVVNRKIVELVEVEDGLSLLHQIQVLKTWKPD